MKNKKKESFARKDVLLFAIFLVSLLVSGCGRRYNAEEEENNVTSENVIITETGIP